MYSPFHTNLISRTTAQVQALAPLRETIAPGMRFRSLGVRYCYIAFERLRMKPNEDTLRPSLSGEVARVYGFPLVMFALAIIPGLNFTFSGHGGPGWFLAPLCFPSVVLWTVFRVTKRVQDARTWYKKFFMITIPSYVAIAYPLSWAATKSIEMTFGLPIPTWKVWAIMVSPFPWWYFS